MQAHAHGSVSPCPPSSAEGGGSEWHWSKKGAALEAHQGQVHGAAMPAGKGPREAFGVCCPGGRWDRVPSRGMLVAAGGSYFLRLISQKIQQQFPAGTEDHTGFTVPCDSCWFFLFSVFRGAAHRQQPQSERGECGWGEAVFSSWG